MNQNKFAEVVEEFGDHVGGWIVASLLILVIGFVLGQCSYNSYNLKKKLYENGYVPTESKYNPSTNKYDQVPLYIKESK